jgi:superfamily I DNA and/or RNA helicase
MKSVFSIDSGLGTSFELELDSKLTQILKLSEKYKKVSDISSLCLAKYLLNWNYKEKNLSTPLFLVSLDAKINRVNKSVRLSSERFSFVINPFLINVFRKEFNINLDLIFENLEDALQQLRAIFDLNKLEHSVSEFNCIGNFHHHRYEVLKDLEEIEKETENHPLLDVLMGNSTSDTLEEIQFTDKSCFSTDTDQELIFKELRTKNLVVQGPPGTGKSQVLVNLISKLLISEKSQLVVSEKRTALDVLCKKLKRFDLDKFCFVFSTDKNTSEFISHLKLTWEFLENKQFKEERNLLLSKNKINNLDFLQNKLKTISLFKYINLGEIKHLVDSKEYQSTPFISSLASLEEWQKEKSFFETIYARSYDLSCLGKLKFDFFMNVDEPQLFLYKLKNSLSEVQISHSIHTYTELEKLYKTTLRLQIFETEFGKEYFELLKSSKKSPASIYKKFKKLRSELEQIDEKLVLYQKETQNWNRALNLSEIQSLQIGLSSSSFIERFKTKRVIKQLSNSKGLDCKIALDNLEIYFKLQLERTESLLQLEKLLHSFDLNSLNIIDYVLSKICSLEENELKTIFSLSNDEFKILLKDTEAIQRLYKDLNLALKFELEEDIIEGLNFLLDDKLKLPEIKVVLKDIDREKYQALSVFENFKKLELGVIKADWIKVSSMFPVLQDFSAEKLGKQLQDIEEIENEEFEQFAEEIKIKIQKRFFEAHRLLQKVSTKLSLEERELKRKYKNGKAILVKEFAKSRQHKSLRELMSSDARYWLEILNPIHLSTPLAVSRNYPLDRDLFQFIIFDEASQIVLPKAISCVYRAKRMIICGDSQQMSPSSFFKGKISSVDLLHQVKYYLPNFSLKHHYRSIYPELIAFSNKHFYENQLIVFPSPEETESVIKLHFVKKGLFINRQNLEEAKQIARFLTSKIDSDKSIGVVAFSEQQLSCIWKQLSEDIQIKFEEKIKAKKVFFRTLEQVQGDECDHLIIGFGYGFDENNKFPMRFGPLNQESGGKRLNVLFSRAKEQIDLFSSIASKDLKLSTNEAINLLRAYLYVAEQSSDAKKKLQLPFELDFERKGNSILVKNFIKKIYAAKELSTFNQVMSSRGWEVNYEI